MDGKLYSSWSTGTWKGGQKDHLVSQDILGWVKDRGFIVTNKRLEWGITYGNVEEWDPCKTFYIGINSREMDKWAVLFVVVGLTPQKQSWYTK